MKPILIEPTDTFFFRDSIPMSAGQGRGAGARMPLPSTLHEALRASLFEMHGRSSDAQAAFRPPNAPRHGGWLGKGKSVKSKGSKDFQSLQIVGPLPYLESKSGQPGVLHFPLPLDLVWGEDGKAHTLALLAQPGTQQSSPQPTLAVSPAPASKSQPGGFLAADLMADYLKGNLSTLQSWKKDDGKFDHPVAKISNFFEEEYRIGVTLDAATNSAVEGQLYSATHARPAEGFRLAAWMGLKNPINDELQKLEQLNFLVLGGERRLARLWQDQENMNLSLPPIPEIPKADGSVLLKWVLATPAVFAHGSMPGWCVDTTTQERPRGQVCLPLAAGRAHLIATCQGKPLAFAGWDSIANEAKPTQLAVPAGSVFYFLCETRATAAALAAKLHWQPRSDHYGEKGCGYGLVSFHANLHPTSPDIRQLAGQLFAA